MPNFYTSGNPNSMFRQVLSVSVLRGGVRKQLADMRLREYDGQTVLREKSIETPAELKELLRDEFGLDYAVPGA